MKKLAIATLLVVSACTRTVVVTSPPTTPGQPGATSPRDAISRFMSSAKNQDLQELGMIWGSVAGPAMKSSENNDEKDTREKREIILMCYLKHDSYRVLGEAPAANGERVLALELKFQGLTRSTNFTVTRGPKDRWYVRQFDIEALRDICARKG